MRVCRTLNYVVNIELHLYLFVKFDSARKKGMKIEIELTEPITHLPIAPKEYIEIADLVLDNTLEIIAESFERKLKFYMFYTDKLFNILLKKIIQARHWRGH
ncbi:hypothetical protein [Lacrimispora sphenoides]|jgi:hypothetical protein|uniref:hypothetical protein n=1 Tax=Lacrimispora sphenoides TaxID=29370 RepID=UPI000B847DCD|nr:hypothetical protein [Lacrimispora sphenoides]